MCEAQYDGSVFVKGENIPPAMIEEMQKMLVDGEFDALEIVDNEIVTNSSIKPGKDVAKLLRAMHILATRNNCYLEGEFLVKNQMLSLSYTEYVSVSRSGVENGYVQAQRACLKERIRELEALLANKK